MTDSNSSGTSAGSGRFEVALVSQQRVFLAALVPGVVAILLSRWFGLGGYAYLGVAIAIPVICMFAYLIVNLRNDFFDGTRAQVADNIYFLGFLYFLVSLSATLILFATSENLEQKIVVEGFGIALVATILGLFLRIYVLQQSAPIEESVEKAELDLLRTIRESGANIAAGNVALRTAQDIAIAGMVETSKVLLEKTVSTTEDMNRRVSIAVASIEQRLDKIEIPHDLFMRALAPVLVGMKGAVDEFAESARDQARAGKELAASVRGLAAPIQKASGVLESLNQAIAVTRPGVEAVSQSVGETATAARAVASSMNATQTALDGLTRGFSSVEERLRGLLVDAKLAETLEQFKTLQVELGALNQSMSEIAPLVKSSVGALPAVVKQFEGVSGGLKQSLEGASAVILNLRQLEVEIGHQLDRARQLGQPRPFTPPPQQPPQPPQLPPQPPRPQVPSPPGSR